jgi:predicted MPP superfamily phosphohydrolase
VIRQKGKPDSCRRALGGMRIIHISDLHFGHHKASLTTNLEDRIQGLAPDLILATGDFVDDPDGTLLNQALNHLKKLAEACPTSSDPDQPTLIAVPGNHDCGLFGTIPVSGALWYYKKVFGGVRTNFFFDKRKRLGFNSARFGRPGIASQFRRRDERASAIACQTNGHRVSTLVTKSQFLAREKSQPLLI